jgi:GNAT superfamily N-acetyltransferase
MDVIIEKIHELPLPALHALIEESKAQKAQFLQRLLSEWLSGQNRFDAHGEALFVAFVDSRPVGICGLNVDPYVADNTIGRVRHLYVASEFRRAGIGRMLITKVVEAAQQSFTKLTLSTSTPEGDAFYRALGFQSVTANCKATHFLDLTSLRQ